MFDLDNDLCIRKDEKFGYFVEYNWLCTDIRWIEALQIDKQTYIDSLKKYNAYNNCSSEFPRMYFKSLTDAHKAMKEFYEPAVMIIQLVS